MIVPRPSRTKWNVASLIYNYFKTELRRRIFRSFLLSLSVIHSFATKQNNRLLLPLFFLTLLLLAHNLSLSNCQYSISCVCVCVSFRSVSLVQNKVITLLSCTSPCSIRFSSDQVGKNTSLSLQSDGDDDATLGMSKRKYIVKLHLSVLQVFLERSKRSMLLFFTMCAVINSHLARCLLPPALS